MTTHGRTLQTPPQLRLLQGGGLYCPDLAPSGFHMFGPLKNYLMRGQKFEHDDAVKSAVKAWIRQCMPEFFANGFISWKNRWQKCVARNGDYVEK